MRKKKTIVCFTMTFILNLTVVFSGAGQGKLVRKFTNRSLKDIYKIKIYPPSYREYPSREIEVKFNPDLSDYEIAQIIDRISSSHNQAHLEQNIERTGRDNVFRISIPENSSLEGMIDVFNRNPDVEYAEQNHFDAEIRKYRDSEGGLVITNYPLSKSNTKKK